MDSRRRVIRREPSSGLYWQEVEWEGSMVTVTEGEPDGRTRTIPAFMWMGWDLLNDCSSCGRAAPIYSLDHGAHFCRTCAAREGVSDGTAHEPPTKGSNVA